MTRFFALILAGCIPVLLFFASYAESSSWKKAVAELDADLKQSELDTKTTQQIMKEERKSINQKLSAIDAETAKAEKRLEELKQKFEGLIKIEENLQHEIQTEEEKAGTLSEQLHTIVRDTKDLLEKSLVTAEQPSRIDDLDRILDIKGFIGMEEIKILASTLFSEITESGRIVERTGSFVDEKGRAKQGRILRVGKFMACYKDDDDVVDYLSLDQTSLNLADIPGTPPWKVARSINEYFLQKTDHIPLDLTGGIIAEQVNKNKNIMQWLESGGVLVWPIIIIGIIAILLSLERLWSLGRIPAKTDGMMDQLQHTFSKGDIEACKKLCTKNKKLPTARVLRAGLEYTDSSREVMENALEESILFQLPKLERFLATLSVLAALSPLLGLLGTVTGMIHTFQGITIFGTSDPRMMSGGISEALITTQLGLGFAIPITLVHHFFDRKVEKITGDMEQKGTALITMMIKEN